jgi:methionine-rich copper-binding protein CopC
MWINLTRRLITVGILSMTCLIAMADAATLQLVSSTPANSDVDVSRVDALNLQFSTALSAYSVRSDTVTLRSDTGVQKVSLSLSGANIVVKSLTPLLPWTTYTLNAQSLVGAAGEQLAQPVAVVFQTRDATWQPPLLVDRMTPEQWNPVTATNNKGVRFVAWQQ